MSFRAGWIVLIGVFACAYSPLTAGQSRIIGDPSRDVRQTLQARKLLADDAELAAWNLGVIVTDRVAVLWGPAPSAEVIFRAELCLRTMVELVEVRNDLFVNDILTPSRAPAKIENTPRELPEAAPPKLPQQPRGVFGAPGVLTAQDKSKVLPTLGLPLPSDMTGTSDAELTTAIRAILQSNAAYRGVQFAVQERRVYLKAASADANTMHEVARAVARLRNVEGVIVLDANAKR